MNRNDTCLSVAFSESSLAIDSLRRRGLAVDADATEESRGGAALDLAGGVGEVPHPLCVVGWRGQSTGMANGAGCHSASVRFHDGRDQPAVCVPSSSSPTGWRETGVIRVTRDSVCLVALRLCDCVRLLVPMVAAHSRSPAHRNTAESRLANPGDDLAG